MKKTLIAATIALSMGAASNASALAIDITAMNFGTSPDQCAFDYTVNLAPGETAFGTYFTWSVNPNIPVVAVFNQDGSAGQGVAMQVGPFPTQTPTFQGTVSAVPVPAAVWLFGSGLLGLVGVARRKKAA